MGKGFVYSCKNCKYNRTVTLGVGMDFPNEYRSVLGAIKGGEYGKKFQYLANNTEYAAVDAERTFFLCPCCGYWKVDHDLSLYKPWDVDSLKAETYGDKTVEDLGYVPYVTRRELDNEYSLLQHYAHSCNKCDGVMLAIDEAYLHQVVNKLALRCPKCEVSNSIKNSLNWD